MNLMDKYIINNCSYFDDKNSIRKSMRVNFIFPKMRRKMMIFLHVGIQKYVLVEMILQFTVR